MAKPKRGPSTAAVDNHIGGRIRERRIMLGLTQQQLAEMIGVTYQQAALRRSSVPSSSAPTNQIPFKKQIFTKNLVIIPTNLPTKHKSPRNCDDESGGHRRCRHPDGLPQLDPRGELSERFEHSSESVKSKPSIVITGRSAVDSGLTHPIFLEQILYREWGKRRLPITKVQIARVLDVFKINPKDVRRGSLHAKEYEREQFKEAFERYLAPTPGEFET
jgi:hypothetical protein